MAVKVTQASLWIVYLTVFVDMFGFGIVLPALPFYAETFGVNATVLGVLIASFSLCQVIGSMTLGRLSDRFGRRPVIIFCLLGSSLSLTVLGLAEAFWVLMVGRCLGGLFAGSIGIAQAYIGDVTDTTDRPRYMAYVNAASGLGLVLGPVAGGYLKAPLGFGGACYVAAGITAFNFLMAIVLLKESAHLKDMQTVGAAAHGILDAVKVIVRDWDMMIIMLASFCVFLSFIFTDTIFAYYCKDFYELEEAFLGTAFSIYGGILVVVRILVGYFRIGTKVGEKWLAMIGSMIMALSVFVTPLLFGPGNHGVISGGADETILILGLATSGIGFAFPQPALATMIALKSPKHLMGGTLGALQAMNALARTAGPVFGGWMYDTDHFSPFWVACCASFVGGLATIAIKSSSAAVPPQSSAKDPLLGDVDELEEGHVSTGPTPTGYTPVPTTPERTTSGSYMRKISGSPSLNSFTDAADKPIYSGSFREGSFRENAIYEGKSSM